MNQNIHTHTLRHIRGLISQRSTKNGYNIIKAKRHLILWRCVSLFEQRRNLENDVEQVEGGFWWCGCVQLRCMYIYIYI